MLERVPAILPPESGLRRGRVRVWLHNGQQEIRTVILGEGPDGWALWARELRFALDNTRFIDVGDAVYRSDTIDRMEPINEDGDQEPMYEALLACMGALRLIRDDELSGATGNERELAAEVLQSLEQRGFTPS